MSVAADVKIARAGAERINELEPLWSALQEYHASIAPTLAGMPVRAVEDSWAMRRAKYERWLQEPDAFVLIAERSGRPIGYAFVRVLDAGSGWGSDERLGELETLSVVSEERGQGVGALLLDAVEDELAALGVHGLQLAVVTPNADAIRFYERRGFETVMQVMHGAVRRR